MMSQSKVEKPQQIKQLQQQTKETKTFLQDVFKIDYINTSKIFYQKTSSSPDVKVNNYLCFQQGQNLCKITEIIYQDKIVRIEDKFEVTVDPTHLDPNFSLLSQKFEKGDKNCSRSIQKVRIFNKKTNKDCKTQKRDKKNIVKNIVKIFLTWLQTKENAKNESQQGTALSKLRTIMQSQNFNNRLIHKIAINTDVSRVFLTFLEDSAQDEIKYSRIQDKQSHFEALEIYRDLLKKGTCQTSNSNLLLPSQSQQISPMVQFGDKPVQYNQSLQSSIEGVQNKYVLLDQDNPIKYQPAGDDQSRKNKIMVFQTKKN